LFVLAAATSGRGAAPLWPYPSARIGGETADFRVAAAGPHDVILSEVRLTRPGDTVGGLGRQGPAGVLVVEGQVSLDGQPLAAEAALEQPSADGTFANTGTGTARLLVLQLVPAGRPTGMPRTGAGGSAAPFILPWLALLAGCGVVAGLRWRRGRAMRER
jgi:hypothetical protein